MHACALAFVRTLKLLPQEGRWTALVWASAAASPLIRWTSSSEPPGLGIDGYREIALWRLVCAAGRTGLAFDPILEHRGLDHVERALGSGRGVIAVGPHSILAYLAVRYFHERGRAPVVVSANPDQPIPGLAAAPRIITVSPLLLPETLRRLRAGDLVCAMIDRPAPEKGTFTVSTRLGPVHVADPLLRCALAARADILFCMVRIVGGRVRVTWGAAATQRGLAGVGADFAAYLRARIRAGHGRGGPRDQKR